jgi:hypothetical protein
MCGIQAFTSKNTKVNIDKFRLLFMYNLTRGNDATGICIDNEIYKKTIPANKFIENTILAYDSDSTQNIVLGHTRQGSRGANTEENAHPHEYFKNNNVDEEKSLILCHNGTISNIYDLCREHKINNTSLNDSYKFGLIMNKLGSKAFNLFNEYEGAAAMLFYNPKHNNILYAFHDKERPLFYWQETESSMYISSTKESLLAIGGDDNPDNPNIFEFEVDKIHEIKDGKVVKKYKITHPKKKPCWETEDYEGVEHVNYHHQMHKSGRYADTNIGFKGAGMRNLKPLTTKESKFKESNGKYAFNKPLFRECNSGVYEHMFKYYRNGHLIGDGEYTIHEVTGEVLGASQDLTSQDAKFYKKYYFHNGNMMIDKVAYDESIQYSNETKEPMAFQISEFTKNPVKSILQHSDNWWYKSSESAKSNCTFGIILKPPFSKFIYLFKSGQLKKYEYILEEKREIKVFPICTFGNVAFTKDEITVNNCDKEQFEPITFGQQVINLPEKVDKETSYKELISNVDDKELDGTLRLIETDMFSRLKTGEINNFDEVTRYLHEYKLLAKKLTIIDVVGVFIAYLYNDSMITTKTVNVFVDMENNEKLYLQNANILFNKWYSDTLDVIEERLCPWVTEEDDIQIDDIVTINLNIGNDIEYIVKHITNNGCYNVFTIIENKIGAVNRKYVRYSEITLKRKKEEKPTTMEDASLESYKKEVEDSVVEYLLEINNDVDSAITEMNDLVLDADGLITNEVKFKNGVMTKKSLVVYNTIKGVKNYLNEHLKYITK